MAKVKIAYVCSDVGIDFGRSKVIYNILEYFITNSNDYSVLLVTNKESKLNNYNYLKVDIEFIPISIKKRNPFNFLLSIFKLYKIVKLKNIQILHSHHRYSDLIIYIVNILTKVKTVSTVHSYVYGYNLLSFLSDKIIFVSKALETYYINKFNLNKNKISVIYNAIKSPLDIDKYDSLSQKPSKNKLKVLCIGRIDYEKGQDILIRSMEQVWKQYQNISLTLVGSFSRNIVKYKRFNNKKINSIFYKNINILLAEYEDKIKILQTESTPWELIYNSDVVIIPSRIESFGLVALEAGCLKKCVIASNVGGLSEIIQNKKNGLIFESENVDKLSEYLIFLYNNLYLIKQYGEKLYEDVINNFSLDTMGRKYNHIYKNLLGNSISKRLV